MAIAVIRFIPIYILVVGMHHPAYVNFDGRTGAEPLAGIGLAVLALTGVVLRVIALQFTDSRANALRSLALSNGWSFSRTESLTWYRTYGDLDLFSQGRARITEEPDADQDPHPRARASG